MKSAFPIFASILLLLIGGQVYCVRRLGVWSRRLIPHKPVRTRLGAALLATLILLFASNFGWLGRRPSSTHMTLKDALVTAPFAWWAFSSMVAFAVVIIFWIVDRIVRAAGWTYRKLRARFSEPDPSDSLPSPPRRRFLERTALALSAAPFGVYGCLGNHEAWTNTEASITHLFAAEGIRILRKQRQPIQAGGDTLNLIGVDFQTRPHFRMAPKGEHFVREYLEGVEELVLPGTVNILLTHNPNAFDRAAELGIDLSLAGHT